MSAARLASIVAAAAGLALGAVTDAILALAGPAQITGVQVGVVALPLLIGLASRRVRAALVADPARALIALGAAWTAAPLIDQHLTEVVVVDGAAGDLLHHLAGWIPLMVGAQIFYSRSHETVNP